MKMIFKNHPRPPPTGCVAAVDSVADDEVMVA